MKTFNRSLVIGCSTLALAACGPSDLGSPGANGDISIGDIFIDNSVTNGGTSGGGSGGTGTVTAAAACPDLGTGDSLTQKGTISNLNGTYLVCTLPSVFHENATLPYQSGLLYEMNGRVDVGVDDGPKSDSSDGVTGTKVELTIEAGAVLFGRKDVPGASYLIVNRGSKLFANGEENKPIIFTGQLDVEFKAQDTDSAMWGGIVMLGRAPVADCYDGTYNKADQSQCEMRVEGIANNKPVFGGNTPADSSGSLKYVQIRYSGYTLDSGDELQSLTLGGVGSGTTFDYIQSYNSSDDGTEFFGGHVNMKHFVAVGAEDDSIDTDSGVQANLQYVVVVQRANTGDRTIESDSPDGEHGAGTNVPTSLPRSLTQVANFSFWSASTGQTIGVRGASDVTLANGVIYKPDASKECINKNGDVDGLHPIIKFYSVELDCTGGADTTTATMAGSGNTMQAMTLTSMYIDGDNEMGYAPLFAASTLPGGFFSNVSYIGAVPRPSGSETAWTANWTCDSATANFGGASSCKRLPVF